MVDGTTVSAWTTAPERAYMDLACPTVTRDADNLRDHFSEIGLATLSNNHVKGLILPPPKAYSPKSISSRKSIHQNRCVEVGLVTRGEMAIWWEGSIAHCPAGSVFVIPPGMRYIPHVDVPGVKLPPHSVVWLALHRGCAVVHSCSMKGNIHQLSEYYSFTENQITNLGRSMAQELAGRPSYYETAIRGELLWLFTLLLRAPVNRISELGGLGKEEKKEVTDSFSSQVESYLLSHYHRPISLSQIAQSIGCSPAYLCRHFRELTGQTPFQYLREVRIDAAKRLLTSEVPIARVAEMVGFDDPLYFSKVFSSHCGESPHSYRTHCHNKAVKSVPA